VSGLLRSKLLSSIARITISVSTTTTKTDMEKRM
jgi:hypothetical protein